MRRDRRAKIVATLGPVSSNPETIEQLFLEGVDVFRLNFSHGTHQDHQRNYEIIRDLENRTNHPIPILMDLQGPKLRVGIFKNDKVKLAEGQNFELTLKEREGDETGVQLPHAEIFKALKVGAELLLDDGKLRLKVTTCHENHAITEVVTGGELSNRKGLNIPSVRLPISPLTEKDKEDLKFGLQLGVEWVALSFVQHPDDIAEARALIGDQALLISKLEKPQAIDHLDEIVENSDAVMVARGDLGVEMPPEDVPILQKQIIASCRKAGKPVIVATQMLDSMVHSPAPTRAEASDVATAIYEETDAVMLSAESASGQYPVEAVQMMNRIIKRIEEDPSYHNAYPQHENDESTSTAITEAARKVAESIDARAIATFTTTGHTTFQAAKARPKSPILGLTPSRRVARQLNLAWGVYGVQSREISSFSEAVGYANQLAEGEGFAKAGDRIIVIAGVPFRVSGTTNILRISRLRE